MRLHTNTTSGTKSRAVANRFSVGDDVSGTAVQRKQPEQGNSGPAITQLAPASAYPIQRYSYQRGQTTNFTLKSSKTNAPKTFEICLGNTVTYNKGDQMQTGSGTRTPPDWDGWLIDNGTQNNATQLHVVNQNWGGLGGAKDGNIGPGSQQLNGQHKAYEWKFNQLFDNGGKARFNMAYNCRFNYGQGLMPYHNAIIGADVPIPDPVINCDIEGKDPNDPSIHIGEGWVLGGNQSAGMIIRDGG